MGGGEEKGRQEHKSFNPLWLLTTHCCKTMETHPDLKDNWKNEVASSVSQASGEDQISTCERTIKCCQVCPIHPIVRQPDSLAVERENKNNRYLFYKGGKLRRFTEGSPPSDTIFKGTQTSKCEGGKALRTSKYHSNKILALDCPFNR